MSTPTDYAPLSIDTIAARLGDLDAMRSRLGTDASTWRAREVGDGNLNLVFIVDGPDGSVIVKQALPYVRLVGDSWPLPLNRSFFEYHALIRQADRATGTVPEVFHFDQTQALIVMQFLQPHHILRHSLISGERHQGLAETIGRFCADTLFRGSDYSLPTATRKADLALFAGNVALCAITENLVFTDPYFDAEMNRHTTPQLDVAVAQLRNDYDLKVEVQHLKAAFCNNAETLLHGDLHTGSIMVHDNEAYVIDPEFALYGPMGLDIGMLLGNYFMAWFAQIGYATTADNRLAYQQWIMEVIDGTWAAFCSRFQELWRTERNGILYPRCLYEDQQHTEASEQALNDRLHAIWQDTLGFAGVEIHRRTLGLAHIIEYENIEDPDTRALAEYRGLRFARQLIVNRRQMGSMRSVVQLAHSCAQEKLV